MIILILKVMKKKESLKIKIEFVRLKDSRLLITRKGLFDFVKKARDLNILELKSNFFNIEWIFLKLFQRDICWSYMLHFLFIVCLFPGYSISI